MIEFIKTNNDSVIIKNGNKTYKWHGKGANELINSKIYTATIIHNIENKAMIDFEDILTGESVYRSEINPAASQSEEWVVDDV